MPPVWINFIGGCLSLLHSILRPVVDVRFGLLRHRSIGRLAGNAEYYLRCQAVAPPRRREMHVLVSGMQPVNRQLLKMLKRRARVIESDWVWRWLNQIREADGEGGAWLDLDHAGMRTAEDSVGWGPWQEAGPQLGFTKAERQRGEEILRFIGIPEGQPFVCMHARDRSYTDSPDFIRRPEDPFSFADFRDCDIASYLPAADYLTGQGIWVVRVGHQAAAPLVSANPMVIDYASHFRERLVDRDFADIFLQGHCRFFLGCTAGVHYYSHIFDVPMALVHMAPMAESGRSGHDLFILKKYWNQSQQRFMTWREMIDRGAGGIRLSHDQQAAFAEEGIEIRANTAAEVLALVREMDERLAGTWRDRAGDRRRQDRFKAVFAPDSHMRQFPGYAGADFLRETEDLL